MNAITMIETREQRDAERLREHAPMMLSALMSARPRIACRVAPDDIAALAHDDAAIEHATGAHDPEAYELDGYEVDAAGTFKG